MKLLRNIILICIFTVLLSRYGCNAGMKHWLSKYSNWLNSSEKEWKEYKNEHGKKYEKKEDKKRKEKYLRTKSEVEKHNKRYEKGDEKYTYTRRIDKFADWLPGDNVVAGTLNRSQQEKEKKPRFLTRSLTDVKSRRANSYRRLDSESYDLSDDDQDAATSNQSQQENEKKPSFLTRSRSSGKNRRTKSYRRFD